MRRIALGFRVMVVGLASWMFASGLFFFDRSDPDDRSFRIERMKYLMEEHKYIGCSQSPVRKLDLGETLDYYYLGTMASIHGTLADLKGEGNLDFDWLEGRKAKIQTRRKSNLRQVQSMQEISPR